MTAEINEYTGLPELPEDFYWRVETGRDDHWRAHRSYVSLMRKAEVPNANWFQRKVLHHFTGLNKYRDREMEYRFFDPEVIRETMEKNDVDADSAIRAIIKKSAQTIWEIYSNMLQERELVDTMKEFDGDYPPKTLNN